MITRLYAHNYRCLDTFEDKFESFAVLCGPNGAGKSTVFDAIRVVRDLASGDTTTLEAINYGDHTKWINSDTVEFEIDLRSGEKSNVREFTYRIHIQQVADSVNPRIIEERATCDKKLLFERDLEGVRFQRRSGEPTGFPLDWKRAALGAIEPAHHQQEIALLQMELSKVLILRPNPTSMEIESREEHPRPNLRLENLTSWFRFLSQEQEWSDHVRAALQTVWPDFRWFRLVGTGLNSKALQLRFDADGGTEAGMLFFNQLSDGEKMLVGLYMIQSALATGATSTVLIDEPDNFVGLPELQPWLLSVMELLGQSTQAMIISHHPEVLNLAPAQYSQFIWRDNHSSPTRISPVYSVDGLTMSETIARGWMNA